MGHFAHASAWVDDGAQVGEGTRIWHFCHVSAGARLGERCVCECGETLRAAAPGPLSCSACQRAYELDEAGVRRA